MRESMRLRAVPAALLVVALVLGAMGSAFAHKASLEVSAQEAESGDLSAVAYLDPPHGNTPIIFKEYKKKADGTWAFVDKKTETNQMSPGVYVVYFKNIPGDKRCKVKAIFKKANHDTVRDTSNVSDC
jgi:hypothetical protein